MKCRRPQGTAQEHRGWVGRDGGGEGGGLCVGGVREGAWQLVGAAPGLGAVPEAKLNSFQGAWMMDVLR